MMIHIIIMSSPVQLTANANADLSCECEYVMKVFERILLRRLNLPQGDHHNIIKSNTSSPYRGSLCLPVLIGDCLVWCRLVSYQTLLLEWAGIHGQILDSMLFRPLFPCVHWFADITWSICCFQNLSAKHVPFCVNDRLICHIFHRFRYVRPSCEHSLGGIMDPPVELIDKFHFNWTAPPVYLSHCWSVVPVDLCFSVPCFPAFFESGPGFSKWPKLARILVHSIKSL